MGEQKEAGEGTEGMGLPAEGDAAPESPNVPAETGEGEEGKGEGEGEGSEKKGEAWSKDKAEVTRLQQEKAELLKGKEEAERTAMVASARLELSRRQATTPTAAETRAVERTPDQKAAARAVNEIVREELGMDLTELKSTLSGLKGGIGQSAVSAMDARFSADPEAFPHYAALRTDLLQYAREQKGSLTPEGFEYAFLKLQQPLLRQERKVSRAAKAKATTEQRDKLNAAKLPGGGGADGGEKVISLADLSDPKKVSNEDLERMMDESNLAPE